MSGGVPAMRYLLSANALGSARSRRRWRYGGRWVMRVGNVSDAVEVERRWFLWCGDGSERRVNRDIGRDILVGRGVLIATDLLVDNDVLPFLVIDNRG